MFFFIWLKNMLEPYFFGCFKYYTIAVFYGKPGGVQLCKATSVYMFILGPRGGGGVQLLL